MLVTLAGMVIDDRLVQLWKTPGSILVTLDGMVTDDKLVQ